MVPKGCQFTICERYTWEGAGRFCLGLCRYISLFFHVFSSVFMLQHRVKNISIKEANKTFQ